MSIIVDDNDPVVLYSSFGDWTPLGVAPEFDATTHSALKPGSTAALVFEGTSISVYGTLGINPGPSSLNFSIDGVDVGSYLAPVTSATTHNRLFWTSPLFEEAQHKLVVTVDQSPSNATISSLFLDYFIYTTTSTAVQTLLIEDTDANVIYSSDGWDSSYNSDSSLESTQHVSRSVGSWAATSFNGTGISLFGMPPQTGFTASIVIDGSPPLISQAQTQNPNQLFITTDLPSGPHTINFTVLEGNTLGIDYFLVTGSPLHLSVSLQSQPVPSSSHPASALTVTAQSQPASSPSHSSVTPQSRKKPPIAGIVGGIIGALFVLVLLCAIIVRKRSRNKPQTAVSAFPGPRWVRIDVHSPSVIPPQSKSAAVESPDPPAYTLKNSRAVRQ